MWVYPLKHACTSELKRNYHTKKQTDRCLAATVGWKTNSSYYFTRHPKNHNLTFSLSNLHHTNFFQTLNSLHSIHNEYTELLHSQASYTSAHTLGSSPWTFNSKLFCNQQSPPILGDDQAKNPNVQTCSEQLTDNSNIQFGNSRNVSMPEWIFTHTYGPSQFIENLINSSNSECFVAHTDDFSPYREDSRHSSITDQFKTLLDVSSKVSHNSRSLYVQLRSQTQENYAEPFVDKLED